MPDTESGARRWTGRALDVGTWLLLVLGVVFLVRDRLVPAWEERQRVAVGDVVPSELRLTALASGDTLTPSAPGGFTLFLVFQSTCPACERNLPAWQRLVAEARGSRVLAVGLEEASTALGYVRERLPDALAVRPLDRDAFLERLDVTVVPTTLAVDAQGILRRRVEGMLPSAAVDELAAVLVPE
jgi:hypothetical protein